MKYCNFLLIFFCFFAAKNVFAIEIDCGAFFYKNGVAADFPVLEKRTKWEWYKKIRPEYAWIAETGIYTENKFKGNGFGFMAIIGAADLSKNPVQQGTLKELVKFSAKGAFLNKESKYFNDKDKMDRIKLRTLVAAKVVNNESIVIGVVDLEAVKMAKMDNPTHMKLTAILPEEEESYTCFPEIEIIK